MNVSHPLIYISTESITLGQVLKLSGTVRSGSEAKEIISSERVLLNGDVCTWRGKKVFPGDLVHVPEREKKFFVAFKEPTDPAKIQEIIRKSVNKDIIKDIGRSLAREEYQNSLVRIHKKSKHKPKQ